MDELITTIQVQAAIITNLRERLVNTATSANKKIADLEAEVATLSQQKAATPPEA